MTEEERKRIINELRKQLNAGEVFSIVTNLPTNVKLEKFCERCGSSVKSTIMESDFVCCPNCGYPIWINQYLRVPDFLGRLPWYYIEDDNGNTVKDYKGDLRLFENEDSARKYLVICQFDPKIYVIKYYGKA